MLNLYIRTRSSRLDYSFLLKQQPRIPDSNYYKSDIEKPTCILERTQENQGYIFLSGIPSERKDHQGTSIRYDLAGTVDFDPSNESFWDYQQEKYLIGLKKLIWIWLTEVRTSLKQVQEDGRNSELVRFPKSTETKLGKLLDSIFTEEYVEKLLQLTNNGNCLKKHVSELDNKLNDLLLQIPVQTALPEQQFDSKSWWGGVNNDSSCNQWIELVDRILKSETEGKALLLNIANPQSLRHLSIKNEELGVLLAQEWSRWQPKSIIRAAKKLRQTRSPEIPEKLEILLSDSKIPQGTKDSVKKLWVDGVRQRKQLIKVLFFSHFVVFTAGISLFLAYFNFSIPGNLYAEEKSPTVNILPNYTSNIEDVRRIVEKLVDERKVEEVKVIEILKQTLDPKNKYGLQYYQAIRDNKDNKDNQSIERLKWVKVLALYNSNNSQRLGENIRDKLKGIKSEKNQDSKKQ